MLDKILNLHQKMASVKSPLGTRESPAKSCQDLLIENAEIENG
jgi:hypothetical protein